jgi:hypothetical protein
MWTRRAHCSAMPLNVLSSDDQLVSMIMGGEIYLPGYEAAWRIGRELHLQVAAHILSPFGMRPTFDALATNTGGDSHTLGIGPDNLFVHMTGMSDLGWQRVKEVFEEALGRDAGGRAAFLDQACGGKGSLVPVPTQELACWP